MRSEIAEDIHENVESLLYHAKLKPLKIHFVSKHAFPHIFPLIILTINVLNDFRC